MRALTGALAFVILGLGIASPPVIAQSSPLPFEWKANNAKTDLTHVRLSFTRKPGAARSQ
jgi:hypothetical protein